MVVKVHRKGVLILSKALREQVGIKEGDELIVEVIGESIVLRSLKPRVVDADVREVHEIVREEKREWNERVDALAEKAASRPALRVHPFFTRSRIIGG